MEHEYYDWNKLIDGQARARMKHDIAQLINDGQYWTNSPPYQTNINIFGLQTQDWSNLKMSFIWSCFAYLGREAQIKSVKSWGYQTSLKTVENRERYWHQHMRPDAVTVSGVYYLHLPKGANLKTSGTEFAPTGPGNGGEHFAKARQGCWIIFPGKSWHRPGILKSKEDRYIVAADMEI
tara:strand:+ start:113 stop:649 length:537 start_codon:yes stop_codon:yes gene_type:complete